MKIDFDYYEYMQQVLKKYLLRTKCYEIEKDGRKKYCVEIICKSEIWLHTSIEYDEIKEAAFQKAARKLLAILYPNYISSPKIGDTLSNYSIMYINDVYKRNKNTIQKENIESDNNELDNKKTIKNSFSSDVTLYVYKSSKPCKCGKKKHTSVSAKYKTIKGRVITLNAQYCPNCNKCFINYSQFKIYKEKYGAILGNIRFVEHSRKYNGDFGNLALESILRLYGYNVNQTENLKDQERHKILANLVDYQILSKNEIIDYLQYFINRSKNQRNLLIAVRKWKKDLVWIRDYNLENQKVVEISAIKKV